MKYELVLSGNATFSRIGCLFLVEDDILALTLIDTGTHMPICFVCNGRSVLKERVSRLVYVRGFFFCFFEIDIIMT